MSLSSVCSVHTWHDHRTHAHIHRFSAAILLTMRRERDMSTGYARMAFSDEKRALSALHTKSDYWPGSCCE